MIRIFKFALQPTDTQEKVLSSCEHTTKKIWNMLVAEYKNAKHDIANGRLATLKNNLESISVNKKCAGVRAKKANDLIKSGLSKEDAIKQIVKDQFDKISKVPLRKKDKSRCLRVFARKFAGKYASEVINSRRGWLGSNSIIQSIIQKWEDTIGDFTKKEPRFKKYNDSASIQKQICKNKFNIESGCIDLSFTGSKCLENVRINLHRPLPEGVIVKQLALKKENGLWYVSIFIEGEDKIFAKEFADNNGKVIGIDPGLKCALNTSDGKSYTPNKKTTNARIERKIARLQRKKDRQIRANNPHCFKADGTWIKGNRIRTYTKGMVDTAAKIANIGQWQQNSRKDFYHNVAIDILNSGDTIGVGDWSGINSKDKSTRKKSHEHAIATFKSILKDKANLATTPKIVVDVNEKYTTVTCNVCKEKTGPTVMSVRQWKCSKCNTIHNRDTNAAINIKNNTISVMNAAVAQTVSEVNSSKVQSITKGKVAARSRPRALETISPQGDGLMSEALASGQVILNQAGSSNTPEVVVTVWDTKYPNAAETSIIPEKGEHSQSQPGSIVTQ
jgi:putative transposase